MSYCCDHPHDRLGRHPWEPAYAQDDAVPFFGTGRTGTPWRLDPRNVPSRWYMLRARIGEWVQHLGRRISP